MTIKKILKILAFIFVPLLPMAVAVYFLFPYLNEEKHEEVAEKYENEVVLRDTASVQGESDVEVGGEDFITSEERADKLQNTIQDLQNRVDSLHTINDSLANELTAKQKALLELRNENNNAAAETENSEISEEEFAENVKSLLDLDNESLSPIINQMSDKQLVRLYKVGSSLQRKKLLRALESKRAAKLMTELM